jgi:hypothetical protein
MTRQRIRDVSFAQLPTCRLPSMLISRTTAILTGMSLITAAARARDDGFACPGVAPAKVEVNVARSTEHVETDISLQQVREAAEGHHPGPVLGLYVGTLRYGIEIHDAIRKFAVLCSNSHEISI